VLTTKETVSTYIVGAAYTIAALLFLFPLLDTLAAVVPINAGDVSWRFHALQRLSAALLPSLLGVLLALTFALFLEQTKVIRGIAIASGIWAVVVAGAALLYIAASADVRAGSLSQDKTAFDVATTIAVVKYVATVVVAIAFAAPGWMAARRIRHEAHLATPDEVAPPQIVVRPHLRQTVNA
jgi:hypothetical protein